MASPDLISNLALLKSARTVLFDCDGVLFDTNLLKQQALKRVMKSRLPADNLAPFLKRFAAGAGVARDIKIAAEFRDHLKRADWEDLTGSAVAAYADALKESLTQAQPIPGVLELVPALKSAGKRLLLVSGAAEAEVRYLIEKAGLDFAFADIKGGENDKLTHLDHWKAAGLLAGPVVFYGDAQKDMEAATHINADFVFVSGASLWADGRAVVARSRGYEMENFAGLARLWLKTHEPNL